MSDNPNASVKRDGPFEIAAAVVGGVVRTGLTVASVPLVLLPRGPRRRVRRAMVELTRAVIVLPKELSNLTERVVDDIFTGPPPTLSLPNTDRLGERARAFTERLSRAADEFGSSVSRATGRAADQVEKTAAKVDEWVEKPPTAPKA